MEERAKLGKMGEEIALQFLIGKGMKLLARNWRNGHKELDLIMEEENYLRVIEVRTRNYPNTVSPWETIGHKKQFLIIKAANAFALEHHFSKEIVFDIISIIINGPEYSVKYIPNAFSPIW